MATAVVSMNKADRPNCNGRRSPALPRPT
jgi:hypothetical protein